MTNVVFAWFLIITLLNITNVSESQEFVLRPIDVIQLHMNWLNNTKNYLVKIENYDQIGELGIMRQ